MTDKKKSAENENTSWKVAAESKNIVERINLKIKHILKNS
jgi:hypothetical protein